jgi:hypothetical protein
MSADDSKATAAPERSDMTTLFLSGPRPRDRAAQVRDATSLLAARGEVPRPAAGLLADVARRLEAWRMRNTWRTFLQPGGWQGGVYSEIDTFACVFCVLRVGGGRGGFGCFFVLSFSLLFFSFFFFFFCLC